jgi:hypothetical protein
MCIFFAEPIVRGELARIHTLFCFYHDIIVLSKFMEAHVNYANLDLLIGSLMNYQSWDMIDTATIFGPRFDRINVFYSTPEYYTKMKYEETVKARQAKTTLATRLETPVQWSVKQDDFFPYSDCAHCFWTGYFTSRAAFKRLERVASSFLLAARQIEAMPADTAVVKEPEKQPLYELDDALGVVQHHDAVSGTAKQHVADDYSKRVQAGINTASNYVTEKLKTIMLAAPDTDLADLSYCQLLNETICDVSQVRRPCCGLAGGVFRSVVSHFFTLYIF